MIVGRYMYIFKDFYTFCLNHIGGLYSVERTAAQNLKITAGILIRDQLKCNLIKIVAVEYTQEF
jgi:hypothetical protein